MARWQDDNDNPLLRGLVLERVTGGSVSDDMTRVLWGPLGAADDTSWSLDSRRSGFEKMESGLNTTARDLARFGHAVRPPGGARRRADRLAPVGARGDERQGGDRLSEYLRLVLAIDGRRRDRFYAFGNDGQYLYVDPGADTVIVRLGSD